MSTQAIPVGGECPLMPFFIGGERGGGSTQMSVYQADVI